MAVEAGTDMRTVLRCCAQGSDCPAAEILPEDALYWNA